jgi:hypothetical protein
MQNLYVWYNQLSFLAEELKKLAFIIMSGESGRETRALYRKYKRQLKLHWATAGNEELLAAMEKGQRDFPDDPEFYELKNLKRTQMYHQRTLPKSMIQ